MSRLLAELLQLDPERHVTARSCSELRYARATANERRSLLVLMLVHAVHAAHMVRLMCCVRSCTLGCHLAAVYHWLCMIRKLPPTARPIPRLVQKERAQFIQVPWQNTSKRVPAIAFIHHHIVCQDNGPHRSPTLVHVAGEQPC